MPSGKKAIKSYQSTDQQLQFLILTAKRISCHYHKKFPDVPSDEFYSIALVAIAEGLKSYKKNKGTLHSWVSHYIYARFHNYLVRYYKKQVIILNKITKLGYFYIEKQQSGELCFFEKE